MPPLTFVTLGSRGEDNVLAVCKNRTHQNMLCHLSRLPEKGEQVTLLANCFAITLWSGFSMVFPDGAIQCVTNTATVCSQVLTELVIQREMSGKAFLFKLHILWLLMFHSEILFGYVLLVTFQNSLVCSFLSKEGRYRVIHSAYWPASYCMEGCLA